MFIMFESQNKSYTVRKITSIYYNITVNKSFVKDL